MTNNNLNLVYLGLGANLGDTRTTLKAAIADLKANKDMQIIKLSSFYSSKPVDADGPDYTNAVALIKTSLSAQQLLKTTQAIENQHGRQRLYHNAPRTLDIDILLFNDLKIDDSNLIVPHPRMHIRAFVLLPLLEITPDIALPQGNTQDLLDAISDQTIYKL